MLTIYGTCNVISHDKRLYLYVSTFRSTFVVPNIVIFCSYLMLYLPGMSSRYFLNDSEMVPVAAIINVVTHVVCIPHALYFYCKVFLYVLNSFQRLGKKKSHLKLQCLLTNMFPSHYHALCCQFYCKGQFCQFSLVVSTIWLPYLHDLFPLIPVQDPFLILPLFPCIR